MRAINRTLNKDLRELSFWLNANKIALNVAKTEIILFKTRNKNYDDADLKIKLYRKRIHASPYVKYLGVFIDENLNWKIHKNKISTKLIKGNAMLSKLRHSVNKDILLSVYYGIFHSHLAYLCLVWGEAKFSLSRITLLQRRAIRILHSATYRDHTSPLFQRYKVLKFVVIISLESCIFVNKCFNDEAISLFSNHFKLTASSHSYSTRSVSNGLIFKRLYNTFLCGNKSVINSTVGTWNHFQTISHGHNLLNMLPKKVKSLISLRNNNLQIISLRIFF